MGRNAASEGFLRGFVQHAGVEDFYCYAYQRSTFDDFSTRVHRMAAPHQVTCRWVSPLHSSSLAEPGCLFTSDPNIGRFAWVRRGINQRSYSICGVTHTISSQMSLDLIANLLTAPTQKWDALICTSRAVKASVNHLLGEMGEYLASRFNAPAITPNLQLPIIPLGIDCAQFDAGDKEQEYRHKWRSQLGIGEEDIVFLFVGRLSFHAKAHPTPMYLALENTAKQTGKKIHLIQSGWFAHESINEAFRVSAKALCPSVNMICVDGRQPDLRKEIWFAADIFTSLSDNIQETFGLTPIEAMAAGLPVVISDWDGYRDTVRHGMEGFAVPTLTPPPGYGTDLALRFELEVDNYDYYIGNTSLATSVDIAACTRAYTALVEDKGLRQRMGEAGKKRASLVYDWKRIITAYMDLWGELALLRQSANESVRKTPQKPSNPLRDDPFSLFSTYPTATLQPGDTVTLLQPEPVAYFENMMRLAVHNFGYHAPDTLCKHLLNILATEGASTVANLLKTVHPSQAFLATRALVECAKIGLVSIGTHDYFHYSPPHF